MLHTKRNVFAFYSWDGNCRWQVSTAGSRKGWNNPEDMDEISALSPDGHYFAAGVVDWPNLQIQLWHDGKPTSSLALPNFIEHDDIHHEIFLPADMRMLDAGRLFVWHEQPGALMVVIEGQHIIAQGYCPDSPASGKSKILNTFSPDGRYYLAACHGRFTLARVSIAGQALTLAPCYTAANAHVNLEEDDCPLLPEGNVIAMDGTRYLPSGKTISTTGWDTLASPGGYYVLQRCASHQCRFRVYAPESGDAWSFTTQNPIKYADITSNGHYAIVIYEDSSRVVKSFQHTLRKMPIVHIPDIWTIACYTRPGHLFAYYKINADSWKGYLFPDELVGFYPSPDGHALALLMEDVEEGHHCILLRR